jgi:hypothetical protein
MKMLAFSPVGWLEKDRSQHLAASKHFRRGHSAVFEWPTGLPAIRGTPKVPLLRWIG